MQARPIGHGLVPLLTLGRAGAVFEIGKSLLIGRDHARPRTTFDGHIAHRHAAFHGQVADSLACKFNDMARATSGADFANNGQNDVFGGSPWGKLAIHLHQHVLGFFLNERLGCQHMLHFRRTNAMRQGTESAMGGGVAIAAHNGGAGQGEALFGANHMDNALPLVALMEIFNAEFGRIGRQRFHLNPAFGLGNTLGTIGCGNIMVHHGERLFRMRHAATRHAKPLKGLRAGHFMDKMPINPQQGRAVLGLMHQMIVPDLVVKRARHGGRFLGK